MTATKDRKRLRDRLANLKHKKQIFLVSVGMALAIWSAFVISSLFIAFRLTSVLQDGKNRLLLNRTFQVVSLPGDGDEDVADILNARGG